MKNFLVFIGLLAFFKINAQDTSFVYFDNEMNATSIRKARIIRKIVKKDSNYLIIENTNKGVFILEGYFSSISPLIENGIVKYYNKKGEVTVIGEYANGKISGIWYKYNKNGQCDTIDYRQAFSYLNDNLYKELPYNEQDYREPFPTFDKKASTYKSFQEYVAANMVYPIRAANKKIGGKVITQFIVDKTGYVKNPNVLFSTDDDLKIEALRVILGSPKWIPGTTDGIPSDKQMTFPINFILQ